MNALTRSALPLKSALIGAAGLLSLACAANAAVLVEYQFESTSSPVNGPTIVDENITADNATWEGINGTGSGYGGTYNSAWTQTANLGQSFNDTQFLSITLTADEGSALYLNSLTFDLGGTRNSGSNNYTVNAVVRTSADNYTNDLAVNTGGDTIASTTFNTTSPSYNTFTVDLSGAQYQGLETIELRIYAYVTSTPVTTIYYRLDNVTVEGSTVIPEPAVIGPVFAALALLLTLGRKKFLSKRR
ncbi:hypothetical protein H5P28_01485 [Ruficoccus amylovorans]|uniref:PEP-CTERM sorting domain-containing protein n=1 Tax=Ruficoccus amylovorans TaxID=1804625 RepID=A0A842H937_9BACT|nr:hypothetical protein [Ruficoccus amylovorans]MBC2592922.1 hypothetical protein [Ruficoccus amylovorans]